MNKELREQIENFLEGDMSQQKHSILLEFFMSISNRYRKHYTGSGVASDAAKKVTDKELKDIAKFKKDMDYLESTEEEYNDILKSLATKFETTGRFPYTGLFSLSNNLKGLEKRDLALKKSMETLANKLYK